MANTFSIKTIQKKDKYSIIIPVAGIGQRMKSYGPKCLIDINNTTIINRQIVLCKKYIPNCEIIVVTGFAHEQVKKHIDSNINQVIFNKDFAETNVAYSVGLGLKHINTDKVIVLNGDLVFDLLTLKELPYNDTSTLSTSIHMDEREVGCTVNNKKIDNIFYDLPNKWAQIGFFTGKELSMLKKMCWAPQYNKSYMFEVIQDIINFGGVFRHHQINATHTIFDIDTSKDILKIKNIK